MTTIRFAQTSLVFALFALSLAAAGCKGKGSNEEPGAKAPVFVHPPLPGDNDCYQVKGASPCAPDPSDPSGKNLPTPGHDCKMGPCSVCGSATAEAFRDATGVATSGWCICVPRSDDSGANIYSCFDSKSWPR